MSDVSKTNGLIACAVNHANGVCPGYPHADALAARVPAQGEPSDDREEMLRAILRGRKKRQDWWSFTEDVSNPPSDDEFIADAILAAGFSRTTVPDAATERAALAEAEIQHLKAALDGREASPHEWSLMERLEVATAALERVRARLQPTLGGTPTGEFAEVCGCGNDYFPCDHAAAIIEALDGAPEPEEKP